LAPVRKHHDDELVSRAKRGDTLAWRALYRAHAGRLVVWLGTRPRGDAAVGPDDLAADAWLVAAERIHAFTGSADEFAGWLFGIARHLGANAARKDRRRDTWTTDPGTLPEPAAQDGPESSYVAHDWVVRALAGLSERERDVVGCLDVVGLDIDSTARALGISATAVRVAHHRGLRRLRRVIGPEPSGTPDQLDWSSRSRSR
jgi:RNA polymerase sigma-70 factor (ECF subfamily)